MSNISDCNTANSLKTEGDPWMDSDSRNSMLMVQKRYASMALTGAVLFGGTLIFLGFAPLGKGLILGALFSILNFFLMALILPYRIGYAKGKSSLVALTSILGRFAIMAVPLIFAVKHPQIAVSTVAIGLFMIPFAIVGEQLWVRWRQYEEVGTSNG
jgi:hypothetical protein